MQAKPSRARARAPRLANLERAAVGRRHALRPAAFPPPAPYCCTTASPWKPSPPASSLPPIWLHRGLRMLCLRADATSSPSLSILSPRCRPTSADPTFHKGKTSASSSAPPVLNTLNPPPFCRSHRDYTASASPCPPRDPRHPPVDTSAPNSQSPPPRHSTSAPLPVETLLLLCAAIMGLGILEPKSGEQVPGMNPNKPSTSLRHACRERAR